MAPAFLAPGHAQSGESCQQSAGSQQLKGPQRRLQGAGQPPRGDENGRDSQECRHGRS